MTIHAVNLGQLHVCLDVILNLHESCFGLSISQEWKFKIICKVASQSQYKMVMYFKQCMYHIDLRCSASSFYSIMLDLRYYLKVLKKSTAGFRTI